jgi:hypothetical protein
MVNLHHNFGLFERVVFDGVNAIFKGIKSFDLSNSNSFVLKKRFGDICIRAESVALI